MGQADDKTTNHRLKLIANQLKEMRFAEGRNQDDFTEFGISRRQIQRGEYGNNITLTSLFALIDLYGYSLDDFFRGME
jgi:transcriptional regulator with XRE-family HTH domain